MKSMTGFARTAGTIGAHAWSWELRSVNGRNLDVRLRLAPGFEALESEARKAAGASLNRGNCNLTLTVKREGGGQVLRLNEDVLLQAVEIARVTRRLAGEASAVSVGDLLALRGVLDITEGTGLASEDPELNRAVVDGLHSGLAALVAARKTEGRELSGAITSIVDQIEDLTVQLTETPARSQDRIRKRLDRQIAALGEKAEQFDQARLTQEVVLLATKADIQEELDRMRAHVVSARDLLAAQDPIGRKFDFLSQEFNREANTICSKAGEIEITQLGLALKTAIDQLREQVQNVE